MRAHLYIASALCAFGNVVRQGEAPLDPSKEAAAMALYHFSAQIIGRSSGRSSVAAAAYRAGERLEDERTGRTHSYTNRKDIETEILAPKDAPEWASDRERLWNAAEECERRKDAQVAREFNVALPKELNPEQQRELVREFAKEQLVDRGMVADVAIHRQDPNNPHAHILCTTRQIGPDGFGGKNRDWNRQELLGEWREKWGERTNQALERAGREERIDHRSLREQGIEREPQRHLGPNVIEMERKGLMTERGEIARATEAYNRNVVDFQKARWEKVTEERHAERLKTKTWRVLESTHVRDIERAAGRPVDREWLKKEVSRLEGLRDRASERVTALSNQQRAIAVDRDSARYSVERLARLERQWHPHSTWGGAAKWFLSPEFRREERDLKVEMQKERQELEGVRARQGTHDPKVLEGRANEIWKQSEQARQERGNLDTEHVGVRYAEIGMERAEQRQAYREMSPKDREAFDLKDHWHTRNELKDIARDAMKELEPERYARIVAQEIARLPDYGVRVRERVRVMEPDDRGGGW